MRTWLLTFTIALASVGAAQGARRVQGVRPKQSVYAHYRGIADAVELERKDHVLAAYRKEHTGPTVPRRVELAQQALEAALALPMTGANARQVPKAIAALWHKTLGNEAVPFAEELVRSVKRRGLRGKDGYDHYTQAVYKNLALVRVIEQGKSAP